MNAGVGSGPGSNGPPRATRAVRQAFPKVAANRTSSWIWPNRCDFMVRAAARPMPYRLPAFVNPSRGQVAQPGPTRSFGIGCTSLCRPGSSFPRSHAWPGPSRTLKRGAPAGPGSPPYLRQADKCAWSKSARAEGMNPCIRLCKSRRAAAEAQYTPPVGCSFGPPPKSDHTNFGCDHWACCSTLACAARCQGK